ncbi:glycoside hydrolase [Paenibacillus pectinilyticus]|uniref:Beta-mannosidase B n=1 Tax=Paenibacillus pectinilyticus TaxID=512399 RepID=A0A1C1A3X8_9BACL|nr:glycoside hydrolase family 2 protein [Paenibacillus pectinilyticus]OCT15264.1 glycoside hydrolase [Paenibacillus pectinilyticus]
MHIVKLDGTWLMKEITDEAAWPAQIPGSVYSTLLANGKMEDPFYRDNADEALELARHDYVFIRQFEVDATLLSSHKVELVCEGLDTLAEISMNGVALAVTDNMHRTYVFDVKSGLKEGTNKLEIVFRSALEYAERRAKENPVWYSPVGTAPGFNQIRKAHHMFGWDWGPILPDMGIWRSIYLRGVTEGRIDEIYVTQQHEQGQVHLDIRTGVDLPITGEGLVLRCQILTPDGRILAVKQMPAQAEQTFRFNVENPQLWWTNGLGEQPLYEVIVTLLAGSNVIHVKEQSLGLRTITWRVEPDQWGKSFEVVLNGVAIFAMGANYIPEDNLLSRCSAERTEVLIRDSVEASFNMLRVWGGAYFQEDYFYDLCDRYGLLVWQDLMFACAAYEMTDAFTENIVQETIDNVKRIRHHASLALWCGNNEMEWAWVEWDFPKTDALRADYVKQFEQILPAVVREADPNTFYWLASPSSGGGFDKPNDPTQGDVHYWDVWHGTKPFTDYRKSDFRFCSEFGFQSLPAMRTIESFTLPEDRNMLSYVMEKHQNHPDANGKILNYLAQMYQYPAELDGLVYLSQLVQADAIRYGVEFWRQNRGVSMGSIYWQLNDCWPVTSWSSIDYYGRWKALHYYAKRFHAPVLISAREEGVQAELYVTNDRLTPFEGQVIWQLRNNKEAVLLQGELPINVSSMTALQVAKLDFEAQLPTAQQQRMHYLSYELMDSAGGVVSRGTTLFVRPKHFIFEDPQLSWQVSESEDVFTIHLTSKAYAKAIEISLHEMEGQWDDNYFDLSAGMTRTVTYRKNQLKETISLDAWCALLHVRSLKDIL